MEELWIDGRRKKEFTKKTHKNNWAFCRERKRRRRKSLSRAMCAVEVWSNVIHSWSYVKLFLTQRKKSMYEKVIELMSSHNVKKTEKKKKIFNAAACYRIINANDTWCVGGEVNDENDWEE
jgi:hypothetical protein